MLTCFLLKVGLSLEFVPLASRPQIHDGVEYEDKPHFSVEQLHPRLKARFIWADRWISEERMIIVDHVQYLLFPIDARGDK